MKYAVLHGVRDLRIEEKPIPEIEPDKVLIKIFGCGICGTDILLYDGKIPVEFPYSPGHEASGIVQEIGKNIKHIKVGDRVAIDPNHNCGFCYYCTREYPNLCENLKSIKVKSNGGFAEYISVPEKIVYKISDTISFDDAGLIETLSCCIHVVEEANIKFGDVVVIIGGGAMGLIILQLVRQKGAGIIILSEPVEFKRNLGLKLGADIVVDPMNEDLTSTVRKASKFGANVVIEGIGLPETIEESFKILTSKGTLVLSGLCPEDKTVNISPYKITKDEIIIKGTFLNPFSFSRAVEQISRVDRKNLITGIYSLDNIINAIEEVRKGSHIKVIIKPNKEE